MSHASNSNTWEAEERGLQVQGHPGLPSETCLQKKCRQSYLGKLSFKSNGTNVQNLSYLEGVGAETGRSPQIDADILVLQGVGRLIFLLSLYPISVVCLLSGMLNII